MAAKKAKLRKTSWNTYRRTAYTCDIANDQRSAGGVHLHQVRQTRSGYWQKRIYQTNGNCGASGPVSGITKEDGESFGN